MSEVVFKQVCYGDGSYLASVQLRDDVLRKPIGLSFSEEDLKAESLDSFFVAECDGVVVGCLILTPPRDGEVRMRQVAIADHLQGRGVGRGLVEFSERVAKLLGVREISLHARDTAVPFYTRLNYEQSGDPFEEVGIPHWNMTKKIS